VSGTATPNKKPSAADPYSKLAKDVDSRSNLVPIIVGIIVAVMVIVGLIAVLSSRSSNTEVEAGTGAAVAADATQETAALQISGEDLPPFPSGASGLADPTSDPAVGKVIPSLTGQTFDGSPLTVSAATGKPQLIVFLAHWCPVCQEEVPLIQDWIDQGGLPEDVQVTAVATAVTSEKPNYPPSKWIEREGWTPSVLLDDSSSSAAAAYGLPGFPYFVLTDAEGRVVQRGSGKIPIEQLETAVNALTATSGAPSTNVPAP
jgi:thiol-disulfide isomerase/thioredoxin